MSTATLTSLAILKVKVDQGTDYLDYLRPFILQVLMEHQPDPITNGVVSDYIGKQFGLVIPERTVEIVLKRLSRNHAIERKEHVYRITGDLPDPQITARQYEARRHIDAVVSGLQQFSQDRIKPISSPDHAITAICAFLDRFAITCLSAYVRGTAIPPFEGAHKADIVLVSEYIQHVQQTAPERFDSFLILVQGHMLANALLCPDLQNADQTYQKVAFYLDTPLLVQGLDLEGKSRQSALRELIALLHKLGGKVRAFSHSRQELYSVLHGAAANIDSPDGRGLIVREARKRGTTKSDLLLLAASLDDKLGESGIEVEETPRYIEDLQIDETVFEKILEDEVPYYNPRAKEYDVNSVRSIYAIRGNKFAPSLEKAQAVFVTSNAAFARAAWEYGQQHESSQDVSTVISDFSLANTAWLKAPMGAPSIPRTQLLAFSYAALEPSSELLGKFMTEIERLQSQGTITARDHQLLRSSPLVYPELMHLTLGEDTSLTERTARQTLERVSKAIKKEESEKLTEEQEAHQETRDALSSQQAHNQEVMKSLYWQCSRRARVLACIFSGIIGLILLAGSLSVLGLHSAIPIVGWILSGGSILLTLGALANLIFGSNVKNFHEWVKKRCLTWLLKRKEKTLGVDFSALGMD